MFNKFIFLFSAILFLGNLAIAERPEFRLGNPLHPGGTGSVRNRSIQAFSLPFRGVNDDQHTRFIIGNSLFRTNWVSFPSSVEKLQGLGPLFNTRSCASCHQNDGRGSPPLDAKSPFVGMLFRISDKATGYKPVKGYGDQIQPDGLPGVPGEATPTVKYVEVKSTYPDGASFTLLKPIYQITDPQYGPLPETTVISPRVAPQMIGLGLIEAITDSDILRNADAEDKNKDGVSGRPNWISVDGKKKMGRFGWKANQQSVESQVAGAFAGDMGITSRLHRNSNCEPEQKLCLESPSAKKMEISDQDLDAVVTYARLLAVPERELINESDIKVGEVLFTEAKCVSCHIPKFTTGESRALPILSRQIIFPYSDFLLHDMGEDLADHRPDIEADGNEWRTPPLWGIGLIHAVNKHNRLLHDGRARGIEEAILWHGGEASDSKKTFMSFSQVQRKQLIQFVESL